jgi:hypothetical protein
MEFQNQFQIKLYIQDILLVPLVAFDKNLIELVMVEDFMIDILKK